MSLMQTARPILTSPAAPTEEQRKWLKYGLKQPGGKLPLYDEIGARIQADVISSCVKAGWAEPWAINPIRRETQICRLTDAGRQVLLREGVIRVDFSLWRRDTTSDTATPTLYAETSVAR
jgi:hypothetical protein